MKEKLLIMLSAVLIGAVVVYGGMIIADKLSKIMLDLFYVLQNVKW